MRRLALLAAVLASLAATGCSSGGGGGGGDTTPPAAPVISAPANGATLDATDLVAGQVVFSGTAEAGATVELQIDGTTAGSVVASAGGSWSFAATLPSGGHAGRARATDAAGNASAFCTAVAFTLDATRLALPIPAGSPVPVTSWGQTVPVTAADASGLGELFPGQANSWVLDRSFSLATGFGLQYVNALLLYTGTPTSPTSHGSLSVDLLANAFHAFLGNQAASEVVFLTPAFGVADGIETAAASDAVGVWLPPPISGTTSAYLSGTSDSRLSRTLALAAGETYTFSWTHEAILLAGSLAGAPAASYQVVLRDPATGAVLGTPLFSSSTDVARAPASVTRSNLPTSVVLSFELRSAASGYVQLDDVALATSSGPVALANGDFEAGLTGWQPNSGDESQNVRSGARIVGAPGSTLSVTRTFYAPPAASWGRMLDVFENTGTGDVTTTAIYVTTLGPVAGVLPCAALTQPGAAVAWDCAATVRDVGVVFGSGTAYFADGDPFVFVAHDLTVPPGGKVALVHFVVQLGEAAGGTTSLPVDVPRGTADEAAAILAGFRTLEPYRADLEPGVIGLVTNL